MHRRLRVLVVEDCQDTGSSQLMLLRLWGHRGRLAHDGPAALALAQSFQPDVVLLDIGLPGVDGFAVARALRHLDGLNNVTLVAMTGFGDNDRRRQAEEAGFDHYLLKPVEPEAMRNLLESLRPAQKNTESPAENEEGSDWQSHCLAL